MSLDDRQNQISSQLNPGGASSEFNNDMRERTMNAQSYALGTGGDPAEAPDQNQGGQERRGGAAVDVNSHDNETTPAPANTAGGAEPYLQPDASELRNQMPHYSTNAPRREDHTANQFGKLHSARPDPLSG